MAEVEHEDIYKHLDFIQLTITRMGANSFLVKGWAVTLVAALLAFAADKDKATGAAWVGLFPAFIFWGLDAYYLRQERAFRGIYDRVRVKSTTNFSLHPTKEDYGNAGTWLQNIVRSTIWPLYLILVGVIVGVALFNPAPKDKTDKPLKVILSTSPKS